MQHLYQELNVKRKVYLWRIVLLIFSTVLFFTILIFKSTLGVLTGISIIALGIIFCCEFFSNIEKRCYLNAYKKIGIGNVYWATIREFRNTRRWKKTPTKEGIIQTYRSLYTERIKRTVCDEDFEYILDILCAHTLYDHQDMFKLSKPDELFLKSYIDTIYVYEYFRRNKKYIGKM